MRRSDRGKRTNLLRDPPRDRRLRTVPGLGTALAGRSVVGSDPRSATSIAIRRVQRRITASPGLEMELAGGPQGVIVAHRHGPILIPIA
jgi:hypothetical protein